MGGFNRSAILVRLLIVLAISAIMLTLHGAVPALAQEPVPPHVHESSSFFAFGIGEVIDLVVAGAVVVLGFWLFRIQGARMSLLERAAQDAREHLDDQRQISAQEVDLERRHTGQLREQNAAAIETMEKQLELAKQQAGIDDSGQVSATGTELPAEVQEQMREMLSLIKDMKASQDALAPEEERPEPAPTDFVSSGNAYFAAGEYEQALSEYGRALELEPENESALTNRGVALDHLSRFEESLETYDKALVLSPNNAQTLYNRGISLSCLDRQGEALQAYDQSLALRPDDASTLNNRGVTLGKLGRYEEALESLDKAHVLRPDHVNTLSARGNVLSHLSRNDDALKSYDSAVALSPDDPDAHMNRGIALQDLGRHEEALKAYEQSLILRPGHSDTFYNRACTYSLWNKPDEALEDLQRAIEGDAKYREKAGKDANFDNIRHDPRFQDLVSEEEEEEESEESSGE